MAICLTRDPLLRRVLKRSLRAAGTGVEFVTNVDDLLAADTEPNLVIVDQSALPTHEIAALLARIDWETKALIMGDWRQELSTLELLRHHQCDNLLCREEPVDEDELVVTSVKILRQDIFGVEKYLTWGTMVQDIEVVSYDDKRVAIQEISQFARAAGCRRQMVNRIEIVADELLMNALYDAPASHHGKPRSEIVAKAAPGAGPVTDSTVKLRYACDGRYLVLSVKDQYGALRKETILDYIRRATDDRSPLKEAESGAGLGLYFIMNSVSRFVANVHPGVATEIICLFDLRRRQRMRDQQARSLNLFFANASSTTDPSQLSVGC